MPPLISLSTRNFRILDQRLTINVGGIVIVLFKTDQCNACKAYEPHFKQIAMRFKGIQFAIVNLTLNPEIVRRSKYTSSPFESVPVLIIYDDTIPKFRLPSMRSNAPRGITPESSITFITNCVARLDKEHKMKKSNFMPPKRPMEKTQNMYRGQVPTLSGPDEKMSLDYGNEAELLMPSTAAIPHNVPWKTSMYKKL